MSVGIQSTSQLAGLGLSRRQLFVTKRQFTLAASIRHWMFPEGLLKWNALPVAFRAAGLALAPYRPDSSDPDPGHPPEEGALRAGVTRPAAIRKPPPNSTPPVSSATGSVTGSVSLVPTDTLCWHSRPRVPETVTRKTFTSQGLLDDVQEAFHESAAAW